MIKRPYIQEVPREAAEPWISNHTALAERYYFDPANLGWSREWKAAFMPPDVEPVPEPAPRRGSWFQAHIGLMILMAGMSATGGGLLATLLVWLGVIGR